MGRPFQGRLSANNARLAEALANPASYAELFLWPRKADNKPTLYAKQRLALESCRAALTESLRPGGKKGRVAVMAANGGGKTARVLPAFVMWIFKFLPLAKVLVTSGAWPQIETQVWPNIQQFRNRFVDEPCDPDVALGGTVAHWDWYKTPEIRVYPMVNGHEVGPYGFMRCITTNEPGRMEGSHEEVDFDSKFVSPLIWIVDEAKTSPPWQRAVIEGRIRPNLIILLSSPGWAQGWFWEAMRKQGSDYRKVEIHAEDCAHIPADEIAQIKKDFADFPAMAESILGHEFMPMVEDAVINGPALDECIANPPAAKEEGEAHGFCDFAWSSGRNENAFAFRRGNVVRFVTGFHNDHLLASPNNQTQGIVETFLALFQQPDINLPAHQISGDNGGGGKLVMDAMDTMGWRLTRVNNGDEPADPRYADVASEAWYDFNRQVMARSLVLHINAKVRAQLLNRKRRADLRRQRLAIEFKEDMTKRNVPSPDLADVVVGCSQPIGGHCTGMLTEAIAVSPHDGTRGSTTDWRNQGAGRMSFERVTPELVPVNACQDDELMDEYRRMQAEREADATKKG